MIKIADINENLKSGFRKFTSVLSLSFKIDTFLFYFLMENHIF